MSVVAVVVAPRKAPAASHGQKSAEPMGALVAIGALAGISAAKAELANAKTPIVDRKSFFITPPETTRLENPGLPCPRTKPTVSATRV